MTTQRYNELEHLIGQRVTVNARFSKYGAANNAGIRTTCFVGLNIADSVIIDHMWVKCDKSVKRKLRTGQLVTFTATIRARKRPPTKLFGDELLDVYLSKLQYED